MAEPTKAAYAAAPAFVSGRVPRHSSDIAWRLLKFSGNIGDYQPTNEDDGRLMEKIQQAALTYELNLVGNQLTALPHVIGRLTNITHLILGGNRLTALPESIGRLTSLTWLTLDNNQLTTLPDAIGRLTSLTHLHLSKNQLTALPDAIIQLTNLMWISIDNNQLTPRPKALINDLLCRGVIVSG